MRFKPVAPGPAMMDGARFACEVEDEVTPVEILLVEDNPGDVRLIMEAMKECPEPIHVRVLRDGAQAIAFFQGSDGENGTPRPDLVLLDLNLPRRDGLEVLVDIKGDPRLKRIPVVVLTTSQAESDIRTALELNANCYITKPPELDGFMEVMRSILHFWLNVATLPRKELGVWEGKTHERQTGEGIAGGGQPGRRAPGAGSAGRGQYTEVPVDPR